MNRSVLSLIVASVLMSSLAQIALKAGVRPSAAAEPVSGAGAWTAMQVAASSPMVWAGLALYGLSMGVWLLVLARIDVSLAYPFVGLGFVVTMLLGWAVHGEPLGPGKIAGTLLIVAGVVLLGRR